MKRITALLFTCLAVLWLSVQAIAQHGGYDAKTRADKLTEMMKSSLNLTAEQVPKVQEINMRYAQQVDDMRNSTATRDEKMAKFKSMADAKDAELKGVFTEDQYKSYQVKKKEMEKRLKERAKERRKGGGHY